MNELRDLRCHAALSHRDLATLLDVPLNTYRMWDSGLRPAPVRVITRARAAVDSRAKRELLPLRELAKALGVHVRTLQAAEQFLGKHYRCFSGQQVCPPPLPTVPDDYDEHLRDLRQRMRLTQHALAKRIGAAGKAVVYQWESRQTRDGSKGVPAGASRHE